MLQSNKGKGKVGYNVHVKGSHDSKFMSDIFFLFCFASLKGSTFETRKKAF